MVTLVFGNGEDYLAGNHFSPIRLTDFGEAISPALLLKRDCGFSMPINFYMDVWKITKMIYKFVHLENFNLIILITFVSF